jgi:hypothetical protein
VTFFAHFLRHHHFSALDKNIVSTLSSTLEDEDIFGIESPLLFDVAKAQLSLFLGRIAEATVWIKPLRVYLCV